MGNRITSTVSLSRQKSRVHRAMRPLVSPLRVRHERPRRRTSNVMNSRRLTAQSSRAPDRKDSTPRHGRLLHPSSRAERDDRDHAADNFFQGGSQKQATPLPRQNLLTARNRF